MTFIIYRVLGPPRRGLLYNREDKTKWDKFIREHSLGGTLTTLNVIGTLTSLAGAYIFLMGNAKLFGYFILICSITLVPGAWITNKFSERIVSSPRLQKLLESPNQTGGVIAALFWGEDAGARHTSSLVKWASVLYLCSILWLEFTVFATIGKMLISPDSVIIAAVLLFVCCFAVSLFTLTYGLRGFVFADLFHVPLVLLAVLAILGGCVVLTYQNLDLLPSLGEIIKPQLSLWSCLLFALANVTLNGLQILTTETHWLRYWIFRDRERQRLTSSTVYTGILWTLMSIIGLLAFYISGDNVGLPAISGVLTRLNEISIAFIIVFWIGGIAALFSTADATLYALMVAWNFSPLDGILHDRKMSNINPLYIATLLSVGVTIIYVILVPVLNLSIDKLVYVVYYLPLNLFPAFVRAYRGLPQSPIYVIGSFVFFMMAEIFGLMQPELSLEWTLAATSIPIFAGIWAAIGKKPKIENAKTIQIQA